MYFEKIQPDNWIGVRRNFQKIESNLLGPASAPTYGSLTLTGLTASRLVWTGSDKLLESKDLIDLVAGTAKRVVVSDDSSGGLVLSGPQDLDTVDSPTFDDLTLSTPSNIYALSHDSFADFVANEHIDWTNTSESLVTTGTVDGSAGEVLTEDNDTVAPTGKDDGYVGVAIVAGTPRVYFAVNGVMYYVDGTIATVPVTGNPIGLLLALTYKL